MAKHYYDLGKIRNLLTEGFNDQEIRQLCYDTLDFRPVYDQFAETTGKTEIIHRLVEYADRKDLLEHLLAWAKKHNPTKYKQYEPYYSVKPGIRPTPSQIQQGIEDSPSGKSMKKSSGCSTRLGAIIIGLATIVPCILSVSAFLGIGNVRDLFNISSSPTVLGSMTTIETDGSTPIGEPPVNKEQMHITDVPTTQVPNTSISQATTSPSNLNQSTTTVEIASPMPSPTIATVPTPTLIPVTSWPITLIFNEERKSSEVDEFYLIIDKTEIFEDGRMRWFISFWNKSDQDLGFDLGTEASYIVDEFGNQYTIVDTNYSKGGLAGIKKGVREDYWFDFSNISGQPDNFLIVLDNYYTYADYQINLRLNLSRFQSFSNAKSVISTNSGRIIQKTIDLNLSQESPENNKFLMLINKVDIFDDGRMRLYISYLNKTNDDVGLDISLPDTYFTDTTGKQYNVVDTNYPRGGKNIPQGVRVDYWLEFDTPVNNQTELTFNTDSYYFIGKFLPVTISLQ